jgi:adenosylcobinamide-GDP ribazoletransferase
MNAFFHAVSFLTRIPVPAMRPSSEDWQRSVAFYPLVGVIIGGLLWGVLEVCFRLFSPPLASVLTLAFWVYITGGLHLDGWMDLADGLGSHRSREQMLAIMKDSRVGAMGVLAALLLLAVKGTALHELGQTRPPLWLFLAPAAARLYLLVAIRFWPYVLENGIGSGLAKGLRGWHLLTAGTGLLVLAWFIGGGAALAALGLTLLGSLWFCRMVGRKLGGFTGDGYGALIEWSETVCLLALIVTGRWWG